MSEYKSCPTGIGHARVLRIKKLEQAKSTLKYLCANASSVLYAEDLYLIESLIDAEIIKTETTVSPRFTPGEMAAVKNIMDDAVTGANATYQLNKKYVGNDKVKEILQTISDDLITVRAMLTASEIPDKGKR